MTGYTRVGTEDTVQHDFLSRTLASGNVRLIRKTHFVLILLVHSPKVIPSRGLRLFVGMTVFKKVKKSY